LLPDGSPAKDIKLELRGFGMRQLPMTTNAVGEYRIDVKSGEPYTLRVLSDAWTAPPRFNLAPHEGETISGVDFALGEGTAVSGILTVGPTRQPAAGVSLLLASAAVDIPEEFKRKTT